MNAIIILLAILVWHFVGRDWWQKQKDYIEKKRKEHQEEYEQKFK